MMTNTQRPLFEQTRFLHEKSALHPPTRRFCHKILQLAVFLQKGRKKSFRRSGSSVECLEEEEDLDGGDSSFEDEMSMVGGYGGGGRGAGGRGGRSRGPGCAASAPPPPPRARPAVAQVEGGGGIGAVSFVVAQPATIK